MNACGQASAAHGGGGGHASPVKKQRRDLSGSCMVGDGEDRDDEAEAVTGAEVMVAEDYEQEWEEENGARHGEGDRHKEGEEARGRGGEAEVVRRQHCFWAGDVAPEGGPSPHVVTHPLQLHSAYAGVQVNDGSKVYLKLCFTCCANSANS